jgi:hypothetical protein
MYFSFFFFPIFLYFSDFRAGPVVLIGEDNWVLLVPFVYCTLYTTLDLVVVCVAACYSTIFETPNEIQNLYC